jgi:hypothetical protein
MPENTPFKSAQKQRKLASVFVLINLSIVCLQLPLSLAHQLMSESDQTMALLVGTYSCAFIISALLPAIFVLAWFYNSYSNLIALGKTPKHPIKSVSWIWFIPVSSLWQPFQAMKELWYSDRNDINLAVTKSPAILWVWWLSWILSGVVAEVVSMFGEDSNILMFCLLFMIQCAPVIVAGVLLIVIMKTITTKQEVAYASHQGAIVS